MPLVFAGPIDELVERSWVRYDGVPLLDRADDVLGRTYRDLDGGDEVEVVERGDIWAFVRTPNGVAGWLPTMTLSSAAASASAAAGPAARTFDLDAVGAVPDGASVSSASGQLPELESILAAVVAQRLARKEPEPGSNGQAPAPAPDPAIVPKRTRSRKPTSERPTTPRRASTPVGRGDPEPAAALEPALAPKRRRSRSSTGEGGPAARR
jgi:hypothetical protein